MKHSLMKSYLSAQIVERKSCKAMSVIKLEEKPLVYHTDLKKYVIQTIKTLKDNNQLLLEKEGIEPGQIEILWTGDKADNTYLFSFQILNVEFEQSADNARCALLFQGPDCYENLKACFEKSNLGDVFYDFA